MSEVPHIIFYSLTGHTRQVVTGLQSRLGAEVSEILAPKVRRGPLMMLRLGYKALYEKTTPVHLSGPAPTGERPVILAAQNWAGRLSVPMRCWLQQQPDLPEKVHLVLTGGDPAVPTTVFAEFKELAGRAPVSTLYICKADLTGAEAARKLDAFCSKFDHGRPIVW